MFTVVIPLYNKAHSIERTLGTVLAQNFTKFEVLIVDDGSTDNGVEIIKKYSDDVRIKIVQQDNQGVSVARNRGVFDAKYEYIAFLDGDDEWLPNYLTTMYDAISNYPLAGMICCGGYVRNADQSVVLRVAKKFQGKTLRINFFENPHVFVHTSATVVSKKVFSSINGFPVGMKRNQDYALFFSLALITEVIYCGVPLSIYVGGVEGQATSTPINLVLPHVLKRFNIVHDLWIKTNKINKLYPVFTKYEIRHMILNALRSDDQITIDYIIENLSDSLKELFSSFEMKLYSNARFKNMSTAYIFLTKIKWRSHGYPYIGQ
jgi:glycosyltransferase involved in cell wall biosynthesis